MRLLNEFVLIYCYCGTALLISGIFATDTGCPNGVQRLIFDSESIQAYYCYFMKQTKGVDFYGAEEVCSESDAHLVSVENSNEQQFLEDTYISTNKTNVLLLGLQMTSKNVAWSDHKDTKYISKLLGLNLRQDNASKCLTMSEIKQPSVYQRNGIYVILPCDSVFVDKILCKTDAKTVVLKSQRPKRHRFNRLYGRHNHMSMEDSSRNHDVVYSAKTVHHPRRSTSGGESAECDTETINKLLQQLLEMLPQQKEKFLTELSAIKDSASKEDKTLLRKAACIEYLYVVMKEARNLINPNDGATGDDVEVGVVPAAPAQEPGVRQKLFRNWVSVIPVAIFALCVVFVPILVYFIISTQEPEENIYSEPTFPPTCSHGHLKRGSEYDDETTTDGENETKRFELQCEQSRYALVATREEDYEEAT